MRVCRECARPEGEVKFYASRRTNVCAGCENRMRVERRAEPYIARLDPDGRRRYQRAAKLRAKYGIDLPDYERMLVEQDGACATCRSIPDGRDLCVDHDHTTGRVRGLLCDLCNRTLGQAGDNPVLLERMAAYLRQAG